MKGKEVVWMKTIDQIKDGFNKRKKPKVVKVKKIAVTRKDIQENCVRIKTMMDRTPVGTPKYEQLQKELEKEQEILKKWKDANQVISVKEALTIGGGTIALVFFVALAREYPSALKTAATILQWVPFKG